MKKQKDHPLRGILKKRMRLFARLSPKQKQQEKKKQKEAEADVYHKVEDPEDPEAGQGQQKD